MYTCPRLDVYVEAATPIPDGKGDLSMGARLAGRLKRWIPTAKQVPAGHSERASVRLDKRVMGDKAMLGVSSRLDLFHTILRERRMGARKSLGLLFPEFEACENETTIKRHRPVSCDLRGLRPLERDLAVARERGRAET
ncbi:uncharacterized protein SCHCODRAFT_02327013 [Schizophyllum commune H4-8]|uniref:uncharacterized protein n=1 Tax=Schizophyllum commune (strain H4-8 / FGSC 9210) TaxID=578458 RepID=UPI0021603970|nr:uncharacterized protein SCHCODRAFT_02327013 [Schizophyllum commune H4-8]KAI5891712.1 hypothetical protein SCHCODRAFT_02327013 [Schizophyllum commune H4-8]